MLGVAMLVGIAPEMIVARARHRVRARARCTSCSASMERALGRTHAVGRGAAAAARVLVGVRVLDLGRPRDPAVHAARRPRRSTRWSPRRASRARCAALGDRARARRDDAARGPAVAAVLGAVWLGVDAVAGCRRAAGARPARDELIALGVVPRAVGAVVRVALVVLRLAVPQHVLRQGDRAVGRPEAGARRWSSNGLYYVWVWLQPDRACSTRCRSSSLGLVDGAAAHAAVRARASPARCSRVVYLPYTVSVGGDFMGLHRFIMPMFVRRGARGRARRSSGSPASCRCAGARRDRRSSPSRWSAAFAVDPARADRRASLRVGQLRQRSRHRHAGVPDRLHRGPRGDRPRDGELLSRRRLLDRRRRRRAAVLRPDARHRRVRPGLRADRARRAARSARAPATPSSAPIALLAAYDPTFVFSCYQIHREPAQPALPCAAFWLARGFEPVTMHIPGMREQGEYYTFLAKKARHFQCPGRVH